MKLTKIKPGYYLVQHSQEDLAEQRKTIDEILTELPKLTRSDALGREIVKRYRGASARTRPSDTGSRKRKTHVAAL